MQWPLGKLSERNFTLKFKDNYPGAAYVAGRVTSFWCRTEKSMVRIFTTPDCPNCVAAKEWFRNRAVKFKEVNVKGNFAATREMIRLSGARTVPVIEIGTRIVIGFNREEVEDALKAAGGDHKR